MVEFFSKRFVPIILDAHRCRLDVWVGRTRSSFMIVNLIIFFSFLVELAAFWTKVLSLVMGSVHFFIAQGGVHLVFNDGAHHAGQLLAHWVQKSVFIVNLLLGQSTH